MPYPRLFVRILLATLALASLAPSAWAEEQERFQLREVVIPESITDTSHPLYDAAIQDEMRKGLRTVRGRMPSAAVEILNPPTSRSPYRRRIRIDGSGGMSERPGRRIDPWRGRFDWSAPPNVFYTGESVKLTVTVRDVDEQDGCPVFVSYRIRANRPLQSVGYAMDGTPIENFTKVPHMQRKELWRTQQTWRGEGTFRVQPWPGGQGPRPPLIITVRILNPGTFVHYVYEATARPERGGERASGAEAARDDPGRRDGTSASGAADTDARRTGRESGSTKGTSTSGTSRARADGGGAGGRGGGDDDRGRDPRGTVTTSDGSTWQGDPPWMAGESDSGASDRGRLPPWATSPSGVYPGGPTGTTPRGGAARHALLVQRARGRSGAEVTVPVFLYDPGDLRNVNFEVDFDPGVVEVLDREPRRGEGLPGGVLYSSNAERGRIRIGLATSAAMGPSTAVAYLRFRLVGRAGQSTRLRLRVREAEDAAGTARLALYDGRIDITQDDRRGDVNRNGELDAWDAQAALDMSTGKRAVDLIADMDRSGQVTSKDARLILEAIVNGQPR